VKEIGVILPSVLRQQVRPTDSALAELLEPFWTRLVGKALAQQCRPAAFNAGTLVLETSCTSWAAEIRRMSEEIRAAVNSNLGKPLVKKLRVRFAVPECRGAGRGGGRAVQAPIAPLSSPDGLAGLDAEISGIVERSFSKYFSRKGRLPN
jgi:hypothetical protein